MNQKSNKTTQDAAGCLMVRFKHQSPKCKFLHAAWSLQTLDELEIVHTINKH